jgi:1-acyl-sn-glycerol-3-phosphate acyltransferase
MLPPRLVRRLVLAPLVIVVAVAVAALSPLLALLTVAFGLLGRARPGRMRGLRLLYFALIWLSAETASLLACLGLWVASGFGGRLRTEPYQARHYAIMRWYLDLVYRTATGTFGIQVTVEEPERTAAEQSSRLARPVIVLSRHAGPGDSFLLVRQLLSVYQRRPRVVMKAAMQLDPGVDVVANRVPNVFIQRRRVGQRVFVEQIERLARGLDHDGALVIFPEGGNWTPGRWQRGIRRLERQGRRDLADRARDMPNVLPPRAGGALSAIAACPAADVIFVAHAGLDRLVSVGDIWRNLTVNQVIRAKWWRVPAPEVPRSAAHEAQVQWLYSWWERIDRWISDNRRLCGAVLWLDALLAEQTAKALDLAAQPLEPLGQGGEIQLRGGPLLLPGGLLAQQVPFPVAQRRRGLVVLGPRGRVLLAPGLRYLLVEITHVRSGAHALLDGRQARVHRLEPGDGLRQQPAVPRVSRTGVRGRGPVPLLLLRRGVVQQPEHLLADPDQVRAERVQHLRGGTLTVADQAEQDVLGTDRVVAERQRLPQRHVQHLLGLRCVRYVHRRHPPALADGLLDLLAHRRQADAQRLQRLSRHAVVHLDEAEQEVLGTDAVVPEHPGLFLSQGYHPPCLVGEALEHVRLRPSQPDPLSRPMDIKIHRVDKFARYIVRLPEWA